MWSLKCNHSFPSHFCNRRLSNGGRPSLCPCNSRCPIASEEMFSSVTVPKTAPMRHFAALAANHEAPINPPDLSHAGDHIQLISQQLSSQQMDTADQASPSTALKHLTDNLSTFFPSEINVSLQGEFKELFNSLFLQFSEAVTKLSSNESGFKELFSSLSLQFSDALNKISYEGELVSSFSLQLSDTVSKFKNEDLNQLFGQLYMQISDRNEGFIHSTEEMIQETEDSVAQAASQLVPLFMRTVEKLKDYSNDVQFSPDHVKDYISEALSQLNDVLSHPENLPVQLDDVSNYLNNVFMYLSNAISYPYDALSFTQGVPHDADSTPFLYNPIVLVTIGSAFALIAVQITSNVRKPNLSDGTDLPSRYDPDAIEAYFNKRPGAIYLRLLEVVYQFSSFVTSLLIDKASGLEKENEKVRAVELVGLIAKLGPTAIKIGQALSIRPDILPVAYIEELQKLQDRVPPFPNAEAKKLILDGVGKPVEELFTEFSSETVAAASLGQVYKAKLRESGDIVAVKVQRPGVLEGICRDLYLFRSGARIVQSIPNVRSNLVALLDNWASRFFDELDYVREGENAIQFSKNMESLPNIVVPAVYMQYTSRKVLTTRWVEGEKLSESKSGDLLQLVKVALNCYLMQLLESGFLHADPHPGNLLRTDNGSLCVLDYGLMTQISVDQQYAFIDYISHLVNADYALVAEDLVKLGFVPPELVDPEKTASVVPQLGRVLGELVQGGGARKINFQQITDDLSAIARDYVFVIPPYFALILRAFSVLEGIGLAADPDYAIVQDCYPYLCKRLITDDSPRTRAALKYFVYAGKEQLDVTRAENIITGFQTFQSLTVIAPAKSEGSSRVSQPTVDFAAKQVLSLVFAPKGSYLQELLLTELVRVVDALSRDAVAEIWQYFASRALISLPPAFTAPKSWPIPLPGLLFGSSRVATLSTQDQQSLEAVKRLWVLLEPQFIQRPSRLEMREAAGSMLPLISDLFPGMVNTGQRFVLMLLQRQALRLADDLDGKQSVTEWDRDPSAFARKVRPLMRGS